MASRIEDLPSSIFGVGSDDENVARAEPASSMKGRSVQAYYDPATGESITPEWLRGPPSSMFPTDAQLDERRKLRELYKKHCIPEQTTLSERIASLSFCDILVLMICSIWHSIKNCFCSCFS